MKLTLKQQRFADEYIISGNAYQSAIYAGYSENYAKARSAEMLENVGIKFYIDERLKELDDKAIAKQDEVLKYLTSVMRGESRSALVDIEGEGDGVSSARLIDKPPEEKEKIKAAELLGKRYGTWTDKLDVTAETRTVIIDDFEES